MRAIPQRRSQPVPEGGWAPGGRRLQHPQTFLQGTGRRAVHLRTRQRLAHSSWWDSFYVCTLQNSPNVVLLCGNIFPVFRMFYVLSVCFVMQPVILKTQKSLSTRTCWTAFLVSTGQHYKLLSTTCTGEKQLTRQTIKGAHVSSAGCWIHCASVCFSVQCFSDLNQMNLHNLAIVFGPTLFQTDGKDYTAGRAIEDLIQHYILIFEVGL